MSDERYVDDPPAGAAGWGDVWRENKRYRTRGALQAFLNRLFRRGAAADLDRQRDFNLALLDLVSDLRAEIEKSRGDARAAVDTLQSDVQRGDEAPATDIQSVPALTPIACRRGFPRVQRCTSAPHIRICRTTRILPPAI